MSDGRKATSMAQPIISTEYLKPQIPRWSVVNSVPLGRHEVCQNAASNSRVERTMMSSASRESRPVTQENDELALYERLRVSGIIERRAQRRREGEKVNEEAKSLVKSRSGKFAEKGWPRRGVLTQ